jgi:hypothetical protein
MRDAMSWANRTDAAAIAAIFQRIPSEVWKVIVWGDEGSGTATIHPDDAHNLIAIILDSAQHD